MDRANPRVAALADPLDPPFLRLLDRVVTDAHACGRWVGLCGELGGQARYLPLLVGLGFDEISMAVPEIASIKAVIGSLSAAGCRALVADALAGVTSADVARRLEARTHWRPQPLIDADLVALDVDASSKTEAIKAAVDLLYAAGRTDRPRDVERAVWAREASYSTGALGHGFAIPHCKDVSAVGANSLVVVRLREGVEWDAEAGEPVRTILLMAAGPSAGDEHLRTLSAIARRITHEDFRATIANARNADEVVRAFAPIIQSH